MALRAPLTPALAGLLLLACSPRPPASPGEAALERLLAELRSSGRDGPARALAGRVREVRERAETGPGRSAGVVFGRVVIEDEGADPRRVIAQMPILEDGYFAAAVASLPGTLSFRLHGYAPLDLSLPASAPAGGLVALETARLVRLPPARTGALKGRVEPAEADLGLVISHGPLNSPAGGYEPRGEGGWPEPVRPLREPSGAFKARGFTPGRYRLTASAPGHVARTLELDFEAGKTLDAGTVRLEPERTLRVSYLVSPGPSFPAGEVKVEELKGGRRWRAAGPHWAEPERKWGKGYGFTLELRQDARGFRFDSFYYPCRIADLGPGRLEDFLSPDPAALRFRDPRGMEALPGRVYLLDHGTFGYWALFRLDG